MNQSIYKTERSRDILLAFYDEVMATWPFHYERSVVPTRFGDTALITAGSTENPPLLLLHGSASSSVAWGSAIPQYRDRFFVIAPDMPGDAGRSAPNRLSWDNDDGCLWLDDVLAALGVERASMLGISLGGWLAARYAASRPHAVQKLVLLAPAGLAPARPSAVARTILYSLQGKRGAEKLKRLIFGQGPIPQEVSRFFDLLQEHYIPKFGSPPLLTDGQWRSIACPLYMACGSEDCFFDAEKAAARLKALLSQAQVALSDSRHGIMAYVGGIRDFLMG